MLWHVLSFYRQPGSAHADLYLSVDGRLLAAISNNQGMVFRRILDHLGIPIERIVLQLPQSAPNQGWLLHYVVDNYRRNGFRIAVDAADAADGLRLLDRVRSEAIKVNARKLPDPTAVASCCRHAGRSALTCGSSAWKAQGH